MMTPCSIWNTLMLKIDKITHFRHAFRNGKHCSVHWYQKATALPAGLQHDAIGVVLLEFVWKVSSWHPGLPVFVPFLGCCSMESIWNIKSWMNSLNHIKIINKQKKHLADNVYLFTQTLQNVGFHEPMSPIRWNILVAMTWKGTAASSAALDPRKSQVYSVFQVANVHPKTEANIFNLEDQHQPAGHSVPSMMSCMSCCAARER